MVIDGLEKRRSFRVGLVMVAWVMGRGWVSMEGRRFGIGWERGGE